MGTYNDASTSNLTTQVSWSSATQSVATINATGLVTSANVGITNITAVLGLVTSNAFQLTVIAGKPAIFGAVLDQGSTGGSVYIDLQLKNTGTGTASNIQLARLTLRTLAGTGTVMYDTVQSSQLPIQIPSLAAAASASVRLVFIVPSTVTRFSVTENGSLQDSVGNLLNWSSGQSIFH
jgi:von Willebrand factor A domain-containing protein 7